MKNVSTSGIYVSVAAWKSVPAKLIEMTSEEFDNIKGNETFEDENGIMVGYNRYDENKEMRVNLVTV